MAIIILFNIIITWKDYIGIFIMSNFLEELKVTKVINKSDIERIKTFINIKYKNEDSKKKALILSSTIHEIIENKIDFIPKSMKKDFENIIFKNTFLKSKDSIYLWDIFYCYIHYVDLKKENIEILLKWINNNIKNKIHEEYLIKYFHINNLLKVDFSHVINTKNNTKDIPKNFPYKINKFMYKLYNNSTAIVLSILMFSLVFTHFLNINVPIKSNRKNIILYENKNLKDGKNNFLNTNPNLPPYVRYKNINNVKLKKYLYTKNSLLSQESYFSSIVSAGKKFDINPLILFAITGQEQSFVPKNNKSAKKIANNPFNVFHSWKEYNSNIKDSSTIAGRTIFNLLKNMPKGQDPFKWINATYAEDSNWWIGVKSIYNNLEKQTN